MLNNRARQALAHIERHLTTSDPDLAQLFAIAPARRPSGATPRLLLVVGPALLVGAALPQVVPTPDQPGLSQ